MNQEQAKELHLLFFSFMGSFHAKFWRRFRQKKDFMPQITKNQAKAIHILYQFDSLTFTELGKLLDIEKGGLTTIIDQLEQMELVVRTPDPDDRRKYRLSLSATGRAEMDEMFEKHRETLMEIFKDVDDEELEKFFASLRYVVDFMERV